MALSQDIKDAVLFIVNHTPPAQTQELAELFKAAIVNSHTAEDLEIIDTQLLQAGIDVNPVCRKRLPN